MTTWLIRLALLAGLLAFAIGVWQHRENPPTGNGLPHPHDEQIQ